MYFNICYFSFHIIVDDSVIIFLKGIIRNFFEKKGVCSSSSLHFFKNFLLNCVVHVIVCQHLFF